MQLVLATNNSLETNRFCFQNNAVKEKRIWQIMYNVFRWLFLILKLAESRIPLNLRAQVLTKRERSIFTIRWQQIQ
jgi:hypothetical protein